MRPRTRQRPTFKKPWPGRRPKRRQASNLRSFYFGFAHENNPLILRQIWKSKFATEATPRIEDLENARAKLMVRDDLNSPRLLFNCSFLDGQHNDLRAQGGNSIGIKKGPKKHPKKGSKINFLQLQERARPILFRALFY